MKQDRFNNRPTTQERCVQCFATVPSNLTTAPCHAREGAAFLELEVAELVCD